MRRALYVHPYLLAAAIAGTAFAAPPIPVGVDATIAKCIGEEFHSSLSTPGENHVENQGDSQADLLLSRFVEKRGTRVGFSGPNCLNASLLATGAMTDVRYVSPSEFKAITQYLYVEVRGGPPKKGDVLYYFDSRKQDHSAVVLDSQTVFQKKGWDNTHPFEVVTKSSVESDYGSPKRILRRVQYIPDFSSLTEQEKTQIEFIDLLKKQIVATSSNHSVHRTLGFVIEEFGYGLKKELSNLEKSANPAVRAKYFETESVLYQLNKALEEAFPWTSPDTSMRQKMVYFDNPETRSIMQAFAKILGKNLTEENFEVIFSKLEKARKAGSRTDLEKLIKDSKSE